jgi:uncharacterized protein (DUF2236 family)
VWFTSSPSSAGEAGAPGPLERLRASIVADIEEAGGRHDEHRLYDGPQGDPGLVGGPDSLSWELHGDLASLVLAGTGAVVMEVLEPSVMAGVHDHSSFRTAPLERARNTLGYVLRTTFGTTEAATRVIERVRKVHGQVSGVRPDGVGYRALDPVLIAWVHTCIPWAVMRTYERYGRPLSRAEQDRYLREQAVVGRMGGAEWVPETVTELEAFVDEMRPRMAMTDRTAAFVDFLAGEAGPESRAAGIESARGLDRVDRRLSVLASMSTMPAWARRLTGTDTSAATRLAALDTSNRLKARLIRWAYPSLPCKEMALARVAAGEPATP